MALGALSRNLARCCASTRNAEAAEGTSRHLAVRLAAAPRGVRAARAVFRGHVGDAVSPRQLAHVLKLLKRMDACEVARDAYYAARQINQEVDEDAFVRTAMIDVCGRCKRVDEAMEHFRALGDEPDVVSCNAALRACAKSRRYRTAQEIWENMGVRNGGTYAAMMTLYAAQGRWVETVECLRAMEDKGWEPDKRAWTSAIVAMAKSDAWEDAVLLFDQMQARGVVADTQAWNALLHAVARGRQFGLAMELFQTMKKKNVETNTRTYNVLLDACSRAEEWESAWELFHDMGDGVGPDLISYNSLISALGAGAQWEKAEAIFQEMEEKGFKPDVITYTALAAALGRGKQSSKAIRLLDEMRESGIDPNIRTYNTVIEACLQARKPAAIRSLLTEIQEEGLQPDRVTYQLALASFERESLWEEAAVVFLHMRKKGIPMDSAMLYARQLLYAWPAGLKRVPDPVVATARAAVQSGRDARVSIPDSFIQIIKSTIENGRAARVAFEKMRP